jgi:methionine-rich copper-binding protein CopC
MQQRALAAFCLVAIVAIGPSAHAHAFMERAAPAVGSTVHGSPQAIRIWFTQELEPAFSTLKLLDAKGNVLVAGDRAVDPSDRTLLRVVLPPLAPGTYRVVWRVLSIDSHVTEGDFTFDVVP